MSNRKVFVTRPVSPRIWRLAFYFIDILQSRNYTNDGKYLKRLESKLQVLWKVKHVVIMSNGTLPIICLLESLGRGKRVLTTPFTFVATTNAIIASGNIPIFIDVNKDTLIPSTESIELELNRGGIAAVLLTQVFGLIPDYKRLQEICKNHNVPLFFDSSHSFGVEVESGSAFGIGSATTASFHATKIFSTIEGGAVATNDSNLYEFAKAWRNFGIVNGEITGQGVNGKMHEFSAAFGLAVLPKMNSEILRRKILSAKLCKTVKSNKVRVISSPNASYFPVIFQSESEMFTIKDELERVGIFPRRYFFPSLDEVALPLGVENLYCPNSRSLADTVLCLPMGPNVDSKVIQNIEKVFKRYET